MITVVMRGTCVVWPRVAESLRHHITSVRTSRTPGRDPREKNTAEVSENYNAANKQHTLAQAFIPGL